MAEIQEAPQPERKEKKISPPCREFLNFLDKNEIPLADHIREVAEGTSINTRHGNEFSQASGKIIRRVCAHQPGEILRLRSFGLNYAEIEDDIIDFIKSQDEELSPFEVDRLVELEMEELPRNPKGFYDQMNSLEADQEFNHQGTELLVSLLKDSINPQETTPKTTELDYEPTYKFNICKDSEFYLSASIEPKFRRENAASVLVYYDDSGPLILQKTGRYKINHKPNYKEKGSSNSTAVTLRPIVVNGIKLPPGTLVGPAMTEKAESLVESPNDNALPISELKGIHPLRLTIFSLPPEEQEATFGEHYKDFDETLKGWTYQRRDLPTIETFQKFAEKVVEKQSS